MPTLTSSLTETLSQSEWMIQEQKHLIRMDEWVKPHQKRASIGEKHPVYDFLFDYYSFRPGLLKRWQPGIGTILEGPQAEKFLDRPGYLKGSKGVTLDPNLRSSKRLQTVQWIGNFLRSCLENPPQFACYGLHEWAMVYRTPNIRHNHLPLRFSAEEIAQITEAQTIRCSHFDAFRFFSPKARSLNYLQPTKESRVQLEQCGCLHVNMDLYKWAYKLSPWTPSELIASAFFLAQKIRKVDMRASPYDLSSLGFDPIKIETVEGRSEYEQYQRQFTKEAVPIRNQLIKLGDRILGENAKDDDF
jgi:hypothetical protein